MLAACLLKRPRASTALAGGPRCPVAELELRAVRDQLVAQGIAHGMDFAEARARFVAEVHSLAASRSRGPQATGPPETISLAEFRARRGPQAP